jgi:two-component system OmpR family response regulator
MGRHIVIVEDEPGIRDNYSDFLRRQGYAVSAYANRVEASEALLQRLPDLAILDIGLDDEIDGGFELCRELRARSARLPIIFLTARDSDIDTVVGLRIGADDYVTKDVSLDQLSARVAALLRRAALNETLTDPEHWIADGPLRLSIERLQVGWQGQPVPLTVTELWILHALAERPGHVRSRGQLMEAAGIYVDQATVTSHIKRMRQKFLAIDPSFDAIEAVYGAGYRWNRQG